LCIRLPFVNYVYVWTKIAAKFKSSRRQSFSCRQLAYHLAVSVDSCRRHQLSTPSAGRLNAVTDCPIAVAGCVSSTAACPPRRRESVKAQVAASWIAGQAVGVGVAAAAAWWLSRQPEEAQVGGSVCRADDWSVRVLVIHVSHTKADAQHVAFVSTAFPQCQQMCSQLTYRSAGRHVPHLCHKPYGHAPLQSESQVDLMLKTGSTLRFCSLHRVWFKYLCGVVGSLLLHLHLCMPYRIKWR